MIEVYIDGASTGNPGSAGAGIFIKNNGEIHRFSIPLQNMTSHEAEFHALILALKICLEKDYSVVSFRTDSKVVEESVEKGYAKREPFKTLMVEAISYIQQFELFFIKWIPSNKNVTADQLARKAIQRN